jgi:hypothetical protein
MGAVKRWRKRRQAARARRWIRETGSLVYPDGSVSLPEVTFVWVPCASCGEELLADPEEEQPMHAGSCPVRPWRGVSGEEFPEHTPYPPRDWRGGHSHGL